MSHKTISNVVIAGGTGRLGPPTIKHLVKNGFRVSVLTRNSSSAKLAPEVDVIEADYTSAKTLTPSLEGRGFDAIRHHSQPPRVRRIGDYIASSGERWYLSSHPIILWCFSRQSRDSQHAVHEDQAASINTGIFLDWVLDEDIFVGLSGKAPTRVADGGDIPMSATALDDIGKAISAVLLKPYETVNKLYYIHTVVMTQNQVLGYAREAAPDAVFAVEQVDTKVLVEAAWKRYNEGIRDRVSVRDFVIRASYGMGNGFFPKTDNEFLGIKQWSDEELKEEIFRRVKANPPVSLKATE
ncbi:uncharacterized protein FTJAE_12181 [Fusarium tjaetaba]|uniref:NAD-dependent epimerase/dehydratase domain-containing protein n=1 Tax=Fusarium tjaetaba TaxID=1567544 RepID=A0A8H5VDM6_9HYPO|nr:uncharacterized protein FTJAE_12181 [Fusarium tjaetaba]KAF5618483.1 hypothetical protein FTJAE_12181 [Fusarium tjaetaba]